MNLTPPLLAAMAGKRVRARKEHIPAPKEALLHFGVAKILREHSLFLWTYFPAGEKRDMRTAIKLKQLGLNPGWPDFILISPRGQLHCLELKRLGADLTASQDDFRIWCIAHQVPYEVCWTMDQVLLAFERWSCLRVKFPPRRADG